MRRAPCRFYISAGAAIPGASLIPASPVAPPTPDVQVSPVQLNSGESLLELLRRVLSGCVSYPISNATLLSPAINIINDPHRNDLG